jgi:hypothetical protein
MPIRAWLALVVAHSIDSRNERAAAGIVRLVGCLPRPGCSAVASQRHLSGLPVQRPKIPFIPGELTESVTELTWEPFALCDGDWDAKPARSSTIPCNRRIWWHGARALCLPRGSTDTHHRNRS